MRGRVVAILAAALIGCAAGVFFVERAVAQQEYLGPTITEILQQRVSINVQDAKASQLWDATFKACSGAALQLGADSFAGSPGLAAAYGPEFNKTWRVTLSVSNIRVGDLLRAVAALYGCDVYIKGQREIVFAPPEMREVHTLLGFAPLSANDY